MRLPQRSVVTVTTNVPGPRRPLYIRGRRMLEIFPYVPIALRLRTGVSILSYCDQIAFGVTTDYSIAPDPGVLADAITSGVRELLDAVPVAPSADGHREGSSRRPGRRRDTGTVKTRS
jgi:hypothetical protein